MALKDLIRTSVISCDRDDTVDAVAKMMEKKDVGAILVNEGKSPVGIITDRDIVVRCVAKGQDCTKVKVEDIMSETIVTARETDGLFDVIQLMKKNEIRRIPVVDSSGNAMGLLSFGDIFQLLGEEIHALSAPTAPENPKITRAA